MTVQIQSGKKCTWHNERRQLNSNFPGFQVKLIFFNKIKVLRGIVVIIKNGLKQCPQHITESPTLLSSVDIRSKRSNMLEICSDLPFKSLVKLPYMKASISCSYSLYSNHSKKIRKMLNVPFLTFT